MTRPGPIKRQVSAGGVIFRKNNSSIEIALIAVKGGNVWCLPKGVIDKGESAEIAAVREVSEETGLQGRIIEKLGEINYWYYIKEEEARCRKTVHFFLIEYESGETSQHDFEVDLVSWFPIEDALKKANYKGEREIIEKAEKILKLKI
jgi:8-oxo-dGTP pyrophosphatase MutT (NUDIX family)